MVHVETGSEQPIAGGGCRSWIRDLTRTPRRGKPPDRCPQHHRWKASRRSCCTRASPWPPGAAEWSPYLIDLLFGLLLSAPGGALIGIGAATNGGVRVALIIVGSVLLVIGAIVQIWQSGWRQGARGQSWGKSITGLRTVSAETMRPIGGPMGLLRWFVDSILGTISILQLLNYLWPLWDPRRQTWADKVVGSVVLAG